MPALFFSVSFFCLAKRFFSDLNLAFAVLPNFLKIALFVESTSPKTLMHVLQNSIGPTVMLPTVKTPDLACEAGEGAEDAVARGAEAVTTDGATDGAKLESFMAGVSL
jgi:hypothetical protein